MYRRASASTWTRWTPCAPSSSNVDGLTFAPSNDETEKFLVSAATESVLSDALHCSLDRTYNELDCAEGVAATRAQYHIIVAERVALQTAHLTALHLVSCRFVRRKVGPADAACIIQVRCGGSAADFSRSVR